MQYEHTSVCAANPNLIAFPLENQRFSDGEISSCPMVKSEKYL